MFKARRSVLSQALKLASQYVELDKHGRHAPRLVLLNPLLWDVNILVANKIPSITGLSFILLKLQVLCWTDRNVVLYFFTWDFCALFPVLKSSQIIVFVWLSVKYSLKWVADSARKIWVFYISLDRSIWRLIKKMQGFDKCCKIFYNCSCNLIPMFHLIIL